MSEPERATVYAVFEGFDEMYYGYPPNLHGLFTTRKLAEEAAQRWQEQARREKAENPGEYHSAFDPLYVVPLPLHAEVAPMPSPGNVGLGLTEWLALHEQGKV